MTDDQFRTAVRNEINRGAAWTRLKILAACPGAIAEARESAEYVRRHLHPVAAKVSLRGCGEAWERTGMWSSKTVGEEE